MPYFVKIKLDGEEFEVPEKAKAAFERELEKARSSRRDTSGVATRVRRYDGTTLSDDDPREAMIEAQSNAVNDFRKRHGATDARVDNEESTGEPRERMIKAQTNAVADFRRKQLAAQGGR